MDDETKDETKAEIPQETASETSGEQTAGSAQWASQIRRQARDLAKHLETGYVELARLLFFAADKAVSTPHGDVLLYKAWGYSTFQDYAETELGLSKRKADALRLIWFKLETNLADMPAALRSRLIRLGWSKVRELVRIMSIHNAEKWIVLAEKSNYQQVEKAVQTAYQEAKQTQASSLEQQANGEPIANTDPPAEGHQLFYERFVLYADQYNTVAMALQRSKELSESDQKGHNLTLICTEFLATNDFMTASLEQKIRFIRQLEHLTGLRMIVVDKDFQYLHGLKTLEELIKRAQADAPTTPIGDAVSEAVLAHTLPKELD